MKLTPTSETSSLLLFFAIAVIVAVVLPSAAIVVGLAVSVIEVTPMVPPLLELLLEPLLLLELELELELVVDPASWVIWEPPQPDNASRPSNAIEANLCICFIPFETDDGQCHQYRLDPSRRIFGVMKIKSSVLSLISVVLLKRFPNTGMSPR